MEAALLEGAPVGGQVPILQEETLTVGLSHTEHSLTDSIPHKEWLKEACAKLSASQIPPFQPKASMRTM